MLKTSAELNSEYYDFPEVSSLFENCEGLDTIVINSDEKNQDNMRVASVKVHGKRIPIPVYTTPSEQTCQLLYKYGTNSKVGKGSETVLDKEVRSSKEYEDVSWDQQFMLLVQDHVTKLLKKMNAGTLIMFKPYKLVVYGPGDFFSEHMDSTHTSGQTMTAVVELNTEFEGNGLEVNGKFCSKKPKEVKLVVFDHDLPHKVHEVKENYRVSVTFDMVVDSSVVPKVKEITQVVQQMKSQGVRYFGFFATRRYLEGQSLKGTDSRVVKVFEPFISKMERFNLCTDDCRNWYRQEVWEFKNSGPESGVLMCEVYSDSEISDGYNHGTYYEAPSRPNKCSVSHDDCEDLWWDPNTNNDEIIREEYCLGNVFLLWSPHHPKHTMLANEELYLGNEGFDGDVHENLFVKMTLK